MKRPRWLFLMALLSAFSLVAAACGGDEGDGGGGGTGQEPVEKVDVTIYFQGALTGPYNYLILPSFQAAQLRVDELNADQNFPANITLEQADTQGDPANAPTVVEEVVNDPNSVAVIGPGFSGESEASGDTYNEAQIPFVTPSATNPGLAEKGWDFWYRACGNDAAQGDLAGQYMDTVIAEEQVFVAHDKSTYGQGLAEVVRDTLGDNAVEFEGIESGQEDYSAFISSVEASGAGALFFGGYDADFGKIVKQARDAGLDIPMMSGDGSVSSTFLDLAGDAAENVHLIAPTNLGGDFIEKYNQEVGGEASSVPVYAYEGYDVASLLGEGIRSAIDGGAQDPEAIRQGIKEYLDGLTPESPFQGEAKPYAFDPETHELTGLEESDLFYIYESSAGELTSLGTATEVLGGAG